MSISVCVKEDQYLESRVVTRLTWGGSVYEIITSQVQADREGT